MFCYKNNSVRKNNNNKIKKCWSLHKNVFRYCAKKGISLCFTISLQKVIVNQKVTAKRSWKNFTILQIKSHFKWPSKIVNYFHFKELKNSALTLFVFLKCNNCNAIYYGKTKRYFYVRAAEHMRTSRLTNKCLKNIKQSAISDHLLSFGCNINFNDFTIMSKDSSNINLLTKEKLLMSRDKPILDKTVKSVLFNCCLNDRIWLFYNVLIVLFNKNECNILNVTVMTISWWNKAKA